MTHRAGDADCIPPPVHYVQVAGAMFFRWYPALRVPLPAVLLGVQHPSVTRHTPHLCDKGVTQEVLGGSPDGAGMGRGVGGCAGVTQGCADSKAMLHALHLAAHA